MWSLTSPRAKRISGSRNFHSTAQNDFLQQNLPEADHGAAAELP
jgi:hypothetical protein